MTQPKNELLIMKTAGRHKWDLIYSGPGVTDNLAYLCVSPYRENPTLKVASFGTKAAALRTKKAIEALFSTLDLFELKANAPKIKSFIQDHGGI